MENEIDKYRDIINLPHPEPRNHPRMSMANRAAQFMPFAALTGYDDAIQETGRLTEARKELDEEARKKLDDTLWLLMDEIASRPMAELTIFEPDELKSGGSYQHIRGRLRKIDTINKTFIFEDSRIVEIENIVGIERIE